MQLPPVATHFSESVGKLREWHLSVWVSKHFISLVICIPPGFGEKDQVCSMQVIFRIETFQFEEVWTRERFAVCPARRSSILHRAPIMRLWLWVEHVFKCELHCPCCSNQSWQLWLMRKAWQACRFILMSCVFAAVPHETSRWWWLSSEAQLWETRSFSLSVLHCL